MVYGEDSENQCKNEIPETTGNILNHAILFEIAERWRALTHVGNVRGDAGQIHATDMLS